jgi:hypothetical protein
MSNLHVCDIAQAVSNVIVYTILGMHEGPFSDPVSQSHS